ncbi:hypothetical protein OG885_24695 [Streptomyces sp. NBC_00028]
MPVIVQVLAVLVALTLFTFGARARNHTCSTVGALALAALFTRPAL